ncbi:MAG: ribosome small subunit-dependent GTPase A [Candidatus Zixiibacteriota bacterium]|nr:MAG: ribosome small subunit-dependent GTPase A [candidate division Zixibacteria bacterium]
MTHKGIVVRGHGKTFIVRSEGKDISCEVRGKVKHATSATTPVAVGDDVLISLNSENTGMIEEVGERRTMLFRPAKSSERKRQVIAANIDQLAAIVSVKSPRLKPGLIDRFLIAAELGNLEPVVVVNKIDLGRPDLLPELEQGYTNLNIPIFIISALTGEGFKQFEEALDNHRTIFAGHSGVGKSTILNRLLPDLDLRVGEISSSTGKGIHTTSRVQLFELKRGGFVVDTPGLKVLGLWKVAKDEVAGYFPEFGSYLGDCRFTGCSHTHEPDCAVKKAVENGHIAEFRYLNYLTIYNSL